MFAEIGQGSKLSAAERLCGRQFTASRLADRRKVAACGLVCELLDGECIGQLQQMYSNRIIVVVLWQRARARAQQSLSGIALLSAIQPSRHALTC